MTFKEWQAKQDPSKPPDEEAAWNAGRIDCEAQLEESRKEEREALASMGVFLDMVGEVRNQLTAKEAEYKILLAECQRLREPKVCDSCGQVQHQGGYCTECVDGLRSHAEEVDQERAEYRTQLAACRVANGQLAAIKNDLIASLARCGEALKDALNAFLVTQHVTDYPESHWSRRACAALSDPLTHQVMASATKEPA